MPIFSADSNQSPRPRRVLGRMLLLALLLVPTALRAGLAWSSLPDLPERLGLAGPFAGVAADKLLVAGGANFPDRAPWDGGTKVWHDRVFVLDEPAGTWREAGRLPQALAYGVSVSIPRGVLCIGGSTANAHSAACFLLRLDGGTLVTETMPSLPQPVANMAGALVGHTVLIAGGTHTPLDTTAANALLALDLDHLERGWTALPPLPGPGRILPVVGERSGVLFVFSGAALTAAAAGTPVRTYLRDAWCYDLHSGWKQLADLPRPAVAAPSPTPALGVSHLFVVGGDDGTMVNFEPKSQHPGFSREVLDYDLVTNTWTASTPLPATMSPPVTAPVVEWRGKFAIPSGEIRPAVRTAQVLAGTPVAVPTER